jgi:hypothetical protein
VPNVYIDAFHVTPTAVSAGRATLEIRAFLRNVVGNSARQKIAFEINGRELYSNMHQL